MNFRGVLFITAADTSSRAHIGPHHRWSLGCVQRHRVYVQKLNRKYSTILSKTKTYIANLCAMRSCSCMRNPCLPLSIEIIISVDPYDSRSPSADFVIVSKLLCIKTILRMCAPITLDVLVSVSTIHKLWPLIDSVQPLPFANPIRRFPSSIVFIRITFDELIFALNMSSAFNVRCSWAVDCVCSTI